MSNQNTQINQTSQPSNINLIKAAFAGMIATGIIASTCAFAQTAPEKAASAPVANEKSSCKGMSGCKTKMADGKTEKSSCKGMSGCKTKMADGKTEKSSCKGMSGCKTKMADESKKAEH
jgi:hypothetical protein